MIRGSAGSIYPQQGSMESIFYSRIYFALLFCLAVILGVFSTFVGIDSISFLVVFCVVVCLGAGFLVSAFNAMRGKTWALVVFLALSSFLIDATFRQRELTAQSIDAQTAMKMLVWGASICISIMATPGFFRRLFQADMKWITLIAVYAVFSTFYSLTPAYTFGGGMAALAYCALAVCVTENLKKEQILQAILAGLSVMLAISLAMYAMGSGMAVMEGGAVLRLGGLTGSPNSLGRAASLVLLVVGVLLIYGEISWTNWRCWMPAGMALACLFLADSRTSMAVVVVGFTLYWLRRRPLLALYGAVFAAMVGVFWLTFGLSLKDIATSISRAGRVSDLATLTGRTDIWDVSLNAFWNKPIFGYGFGSTKALLPEIYRTYWGFTVTHAHNLYIQTMVTLGLVGLGLVVTILVRQVLSFFRRQDVFKTVVLGFILVHGMTEPGPIGVTPNIVTFFWALSLCWDRILVREQEIAGKAPCPENKVN